MVISACRDDFFGPDVYSVAGDVRSETQCGLALWPGKGDVSRHVVVNAMQPPIPAELQTQMSSYIHTIFERFAMSRFSCEGAFGYQHDVQSIVEGNSVAWSRSIGEL